MVLNQVGDITSTPTLKLKLAKHCQLFSAELSGDFVTRSLTVADLVDRGYPGDVDKRSSRQQLNPKIPILEVVEPGIELQRGGLACNGGSEQG